MRARLIRPKRSTSSILRSIRLAVFDFDGVFTDNRVLVSEDGTESVFCTRADGIGLNALLRAGVGALVMSTETNPVVRVRSAKLGIECVQGCDDKWALLEQILRDRRISPAEVAFVGNDVNDLECLRNVGLPICVADAHPHVRRASAVVTKTRGGYGAVREVCDLIADARRAGARAPGPVGRRRRTA